MIDLNKFCVAKDTRTQIESPWSVGEHSYATNGHILVRLPRSPEIVREDGPDLAKIYATVDAAAPLFPLPAFTAPPAGECEPCNGSGWVVVCRRCHGDGSWECDECGTEVDCDDCDREGRHPSKAGKEGATACSKCNGTGQDRGNLDSVRVKIAPNLYIKLRYAIWLSELPNIRIALGRSEGERGTSSPIPFAFDGGDGLIMPMHGPDIDRADVIVAAGVDHVTEHPKMAEKVSS